MSICQKNMNILVPLDGSDHSERALDTALELVDAVCGHFVKEDRVGIEQVVVHERQFVTLFIEERQGGLEPARDSIGQKGH